MFVCVVYVDNIMRHKFKPSANDGTGVMLVRAKYSRPWLVSTLGLCSQLHKLGYEVPKGKDSGHSGKVVRLSCKTVLFFPLSLDQSDRCRLKWLKCFLGFFSSLR